MKRIPQTPHDLPALPRRRFLQGLAAGGVLLGAAPWLNATAAREMPATAIGRVGGSTCRVGGSAAPAAGSPTC